MRAFSVGTDLGMQSSNYREPLRTGSLEVYEGFDFGFNSGRTPMARTPAGRTPGRTPGRTLSDPGAGGDYFGIQPTSHWSDSEDDDDDDEDEELDMDETPGGPGPATGMGEVEESPVRPRPQPTDSTESPVKKFIERGEWKRRGIVFTAATAPTTTKPAADPFSLEG